MGDDGIYKARCPCGRLHLSVEADPVLNAICHCDDCHRRTGGAFGWSAYFTETAVAMTGEASTYHPKRIPGQVRHFCPDCGATMMWTTPGLKGLIGCAGGAFLDPALPEPTASYRLDQKNDWMIVPTGLQRH